MCIRDRCNWLLEKLILTARQLGPEQVWADEVMANWLWQPDQIRLEDFLANDDQRTGYHLQRWQAEAPAALAELSGRFLDRRLLKATAVEHLSPAEQLQLLATARRLADRHGHDPELCCGLRHQQLRGYHPYRGGLRLWDGQQLQALEKASPLVASLATPAATSWLIHPRDISNELRQEMDVEWPRAAAA